MLKISNITKKFGEIVALNNISITFAKGEIHGLVGKNGAGKSTLVDIIYGWILPTSGSIIINGNEIDLRGFQPEDAKKLKIGLVPQHPLFAEDLSIEDNLFLGSEKLDNFSNLNKKFMKKKTREILQKVGLDNYDPETIVEEMSIADKQLLNIGQVLYLKNVEFLLLDEIAAGLSEKQMHFVSEQLRKERDKGKTIIYVSHRLKEVIGLCDRITVLRNGNKIITEDIKKLTFNEITDYIIGVKTKLHTFFEDENYFKDYKANPLLEVKNLYDDHFLRNINFKAYKGEVLGFAGLIGSGVKQLMEIICGVEHLRQGEIIYKGEKIIFSDPNEAIKKGIIYLSDNREGDSLFGDFSVKDNMVAGSWKDLSGFLGIDSNREIKLFYSISKRLSLKYGNYSDNIGTLSGGNRQKVCIGRLINRNPSIFILNQPIKGIDIGVKYELLELIRTKLTKDSLVILSTPGINELLTIADRIVVLYKGEIHKVIPRNEFSETKIFKAIQGG